MGTPAPSPIQPSPRLRAGFYQRSAVVEIARELLGKVLVTEIGGARAAGRIAETEAYRAPDDRACHAFNNLRTPRTEVMFAPGGHAYVYLCYGIHHLFNVVTGRQGEAHAVLIRAVEPVRNLALMQRRRGSTHTDRRLTGGPGRLAQALGIRTKHSGLPLTDPQSPIWIEEGEPPAGIAVSRRIGVESAGQCAARPWRFFIEGSRWVSRAR